MAKLLEDPVPVALVKLPASIRWADSELESVRLDYDSIVIAVRDEAGDLHNIRANGYIGFTYTGVWDEAIIASGALLDDDEHALDSWRQIEARFAGAIPLSGSDARNRRQWKTLALIFSDGSELKCSAVEFNEE